MAGPGGHRPHGPEHSGSNNPQHSERRQFHRLHQLRAVLRRPLRPFQRELAVARLGSPTTTHLAGGVSCGRSPCGGCLATATTAVRCRGVVSRRRGYLLKQAVNHSLAVRKMCSISRNAPNPRQAAHQHERHEWHKPPRMISARTHRRCSREPFPSWSLLPSVRGDNPMSRRNLGAVSRGPHRDGSHEFG